MGYYEFKVKRDELHELLGHSLPDSSLIYIEGDYGSGKSIISQRLLYGFLNNGLSVTYISTEMTVKDFISQMESLDYSVIRHLLDGNLLYIPVYPLIGEAKGRGDFLSRLTTSSSLFRSDVIIIDAFSSLVKYSMSGEEKSITVLSFFKKLTGMGKEIIITIDPKDLSDSVFAPFRATSAIYLALNTKFMGGAIQHSIIVKRFMNANSRVDDVIGFKVEPKIGIVIEITAIS